MTSVIVLCGGLGSRMGELGRIRQKCLSPVWGTPLLELILTRLCPALPDPRTQVILLTGHHGGQVAELAEQWRTRLDLRIQAVAEHKPGWVGVEHAARGLPDPVLVVAGNVLLDHTALVPRLLDQYQHNGRPVAAASLSWRTTNHHTLTAEKNTVTSWHRAPDRAGHYEVTDTYLLTRPVLDLMRTRQISHSRALATLVPHRALGFCAVPGDWLHVETPADLLVDPDRKASLCPLLSSCPVLPPPARAPSPASSPSA